VDNLNLKVPILQALNARGHLAKLPCQSSEIESGEENGCDAKLANPNE